MRRVHFLASVFAVGLCFASCAGDEAKKRVASSDAGQAGQAGEGGSTNDAGSSNTSGEGGIPAQAGQGGQGPSLGGAGAAQGGMPAQGGEGGSPAPMLVCYRGDGGAPGEAGAGGADRPLEWIDFAADTCRTCPGAVPNCRDWLPGTQFDPETSVLTVQLSPGLAEVAVARFDYNYWYFDGQSSAYGGVAEAEGVVDQNQAMFDLSATVPPTLEQFRGSITVTDTCGVESTSSDNVTEEIRVYLTPTGAAGAPGEPEVTTECNNFD